MKQLKEKRTKINRKTYWETKRKGKEDGKNMKKSERQKNQKTEHRNKEKQ